MARGMAARATLSFLLFLCMPLWVAAFIVDSPPQLATYSFTPYLAQFSAPVYTQVTGLLANASFACDTLDPATYNGTIAFVDRGECTFIQKALIVQAAGALAMILVDTELIPSVMAGTGDVTIVCESIGSEEGDLIKGYMFEGYNVTVTIKQDPMPASEVALLMELYYALNGPSWTFQDKPHVDWKNGTDPCQNAWTGIGCQINGGHLRVISLTDFGASGALPDSISQLTYLDTFQVDNNNIVGPFPEWLCGLPLLSLLELSSNGFYGTIPTCLGSLQNLTTISLSSNSFNGTIPEDIYNLAGLTGLALDNNQISGTISPNLNNLVNLETFTVRNNQLEGPLPLFSGLINLLELDVGYNQLNGTIPDFQNGDLILMTLIVSNNQFYGTLPDMNQLPMLNHIDISNNLFDGTIPYGKQLPPSIQYLYASHNSYSSIDPSFATASTLLTVDFSYNALNITDITLFAALPLCDTISVLLGQCLQNIDVSNNMLHVDPSYDVFSLDLDNWPSLLSINLENNQLSKSLKMTLDNNLLTSLDLSNNKLSGAISANFNSLPSLRTLDLSSNNFSYSGGSLLPLALFPDYNTYVYYADYSFSCPTIRITQSNVAVSLDPSYYAYQLCQCEQNYRRKNNFTTPGFPFDFTCIKCPDVGMQCPGKAQDTTYIIDAYYWPTPSFEDPQELLECDFCQENATCAPNHEGRLCSRCSDGYYNRGTNCSSCAPIGTLAVAVSILILVLIVLIFTSCGTLQRQFCRSCMLRAKRRLTGAPRPQSVNFAKGAQTKKKKERAPAQYAVSIAINYYQTISALSEYFKLPVSIESLLSTIRVITSVTGSGIGIQCLHPNLHEFRFYYLAIMMEPVVCVAVIGLVWLMGEIALLIYQGKVPIMLRKWRPKCLKITLFTLNFLFFPIVSTTINAFRCSADPVTGIEYNRAFQYSHCDEVPLVARVIAFLIYGPGMVALFTALVVYYHYHPDKTGIVYKSFGFFFTPFREGYLHFSVLILLRRFIISLLVSLIRVDSALSFGLNSAVLCISILGIFYTRPYKTGVDNNMEIVMGICLIYAYGLALVMGVPALGFGAAVMQVFYFLINIGMLCWCLYELGRAVSPYVLQIVKALFGLTAELPPDDEDATNSNGIALSPTSSSAALSPTSSTAALTSSSV